jgi:hypothetical protein
VIRSVFVVFCCDRQETERGDKLPLAIRFARDTCGTRAGGVAALPHSLEKIDIELAEAAPHEQALHSPRSVTRRERRRIGTVYRTAMS